MRVSERLRLLVFIQKYIYIFIYKYNFAFGNLKYLRHKPLNLNTGFYSPGLVILIFLFFFPMGPPVPLSRIC